jgi:hypothetical protein
MTKLETPTSPLDFLFLKSLITLVILSSFVSVKNIEAEVGIFRCPWNKITL